VDNFWNFPLRIDFPAVDGSPERKVFEKFLAKKFSSHSDLIFKCQFEVKSVSLTFTPDFKMIQLLLGENQARYVTKSQVSYPLENILKGK